MSLPYTRKALSFILDEIVKFLSLFGKTERIFKYILHE